MHNAQNVFDIATDMDEVLVMTNEKWFKAILSDKFLMAEMPKENVERAIRSHPMNRTEYSIFSHFSDDHKGFDPMFCQRMLDKYFMDDTFYDDLRPSKYYYNLLTMLEHGVLRSVTVVTSCIELAYPVTKSKVRYLNKIFEPFRNRGVQVRFLFTEKKETKAEAINDNEVQYHTFVDDALHNIIDVARNTVSFNREFHIPRYRFNIDFKEANSIAAEKGCKFFWFDNDLVLSNDRLTNPHDEHSLASGEELAWHV